ncbi:unnamed protein product [Dracunculus medinensis]|uniref:Protein hook n=1 Tax=Dracunculus medinensis TaxID=318479 RepID=A0A0N4U3A0_DRAME|nr:unnamed protein product [Dracunculus medinensis]
MTEELLDDLIAWLASLSTEIQFSKETVFIGRCIAEILHKIDPFFFDSSWLEKIASYEPTANWRVRANNLRKVYRRLDEFYKERLSIELKDQWNIDISQMVENDDYNLLYRLLQLVLAAALLGPNNRDFVSMFVNQSHSLVEMAMKLVEEFKLIQPVTSEYDSNTISPIEVQCSPPTSNGTDALVQTIEQLREDHNQQQEQISQLKSENELLLRENDNLKNRIDELSDSGTEAESLKRRLRSVQAIKESTQESLYKLEAERDHLKESLEQIVAENTELRTKIREMEPYEEENRRLKDELEEFRLHSQESAAINAQIESYKNKIKEYSSQKLEIKVLEEKVATYMKSVIALEDEQMKNGVLKTRIESLRLENDELNNKLREEIRRGDKAEFECKRLSEKVTEITNERDSIRVEHREMKEKMLLDSGGISNILFYNTHGEITANAMSSVPSIHEETLEAIESSSMLKDRITKLEIENDRLRQLVCDKTKIDLLKEELEAVTAQKIELETELRLCYLKNVEIETRLNEANEILSSATFVNDNKRAEQQENNEKLGVLVAHLQAQLNQANRDLESSVADKKELTSRIEALELELQDEKSKLKRYMEKARRVIVDLEEQSRAVESGALSRHEFDSIRKERDAYKQNIETMKETLERSRIMQEEEQRLITTHAYHMMMRLQRENLPDNDDAERNGSTSIQKTFFNRLPCSGLDLSR